MAKKTTNSGLTVNTDNVWPKETGRIFRVELIRTNATLKGNNFHFQTNLGPRCLDAKNEAVKRPQPTQARVFISQ